MQHVGFKLTKDVKDLYNESCKTQMKEMGKRHKNKEIFQFVDWKNQ